MLQTDGEASSSSSAGSALAAGVTIRRWIMRRSVAAGAGGSVPPAPAGQGYPAKNSSRAATAVSVKSENRPSMPSA